MKIQCYATNLFYLTEKNFNRGFTFTQLLIVIAITGVMPAVFMPWLIHRVALPEYRILVGDRASTVTSDR